MGKVEWFQVRRYQRKFYSSHKWVQSEEEEGEEEKVEEVVEKEKGRSR